MERGSGSGSGSYRGDGSGGQEHAGPAVAAAREPAGCVQAFFVDSVSEKERAWRADGAGGAGGERISCDKVGADRTG
ncbi:hypothetical protein G3M48_002586 [Beauveria asiatica]|uniref:Uncharacterized protein n=1 Tax=Beauveria asiatica TaxID=1069075 RepID=A0AAW0RX03_9HYPO